MLDRNKHSCLYCVVTFCLVFGGTRPAQAVNAPIPEDTFTPISIETPSTTAHRLGRGTIFITSSTAQIAQINLPGQKASLATVEGKVTDFNGERAIGNVHVVAEFMGLEEKRLEIETSQDGSFSLAGLTPGEWKLTFSAANMLAETKKLVLSPGETKSLKIVLEEVEAADVLRITGKRTLIHPEKIGSETNLDHTFIQEYKSGNDLRDLIKSTPGVLPDSYGNVIVRGEHNAINYELDGAVLPETAGVLQQTQFVTPRSLQSMKVDIGGYQAQDGGGPLGAVVHMKSLPIKPKPTLEIGGQLGGPLAGSLIFYASGALSQKSGLLHRIRYELSGASVATTLGLEPPVKHFVRNSRLDMNYLGKLEFLATENDTFRLTGMINESFIQIPTPGTSYAFGVRMNQHDRQDVIMLSYKHRFQRWFDEANLHVINAFYSERLKSHNAFDPLPIINGEGDSVNSVSPTAKRFNYVFSTQGDITKTLFNSHKLKIGFLSELRPVSTQFSGLYYNANLRATLQGQIEAQQSGSENTNPLPYAASISPFTGTTNGPLFIGSIGRFTGFRYLQSAFFQDTLRPTKGILKRLTLDAGVRADVYHGVFGDTLKVAQTLLSIPDVPPFLLAPFQTQRITNAQASGRFGGAFVVTKDTVIRGSFSNIFQPPPVDVFVTPPNINKELNGIFANTIRPLAATRGLLVDTSVEQQIGPRFVMRTNLFYKKLRNFGDSGVIANTPIYNRLSLSDLETHGVETRLDLKPDREGYGFNGYVSNTVQYARLHGCKCTTGGLYDAEPPPSLRSFPDHDRRYELSAALGYKSHTNLWYLFEISTYTGLLDSRDPAFYGAHPARTPVREVLGFNMGYQFPKKLREGRWFIPLTADVRIQNLLNQRYPINLGSPFQGTRYSLPIRVLAGVNWGV